MNWSHHARFRTGLETGRARIARRADVRREWPDTAWERKAKATLILRPLSDWSKAVVDILKPHAWDKPSWPLPRSARRQGNIGQGGNASGSVLGLVPLVQFVERPNHCALEPRKLAGPNELNRSNGTISLLGYDEFSLVPVLISGIVALRCLTIAVNKDHDIGILFDRTGLAKVA